MRLECASLAGRGLGLHHRDVHVVPVDLRAAQRQRGNVVVLNKINGFVQVWEQARVLVQIFQRIVQHKYPLFF